MPPPGSVAAPAPTPRAARRRPSPPGLSWLRRRPVAAAALIYGLLAVILYAPALVPGHTLSASDYLWTSAPWSSSRPADVRAFGANYELLDSVTQFQPWLQYTRERLPDVPLWNPAIGGGRPFLANAQSAIFSPFSVPSYVLPFWWSRGVVAVLKVFLAAFGMFLLARALGLRFGGALLSGLVFAFSLYFLVWIAWPHTDVWAFIPWVLLAVEGVIRRPGPLSAAALAGVVALQFFGGHPESNFHALGVGVVFFAFRLLVRRREGERVRAGAACVVLAGGLALGAALSALTLVPFLELLGRSNDVATRQTFWQIDLPREYLLGFALHEYWGRGTGTGIGAFAQGRALYAGALPLVLAGVALVVRPSLLRVGVALFGALMLAVVLGVPPLPEIIRHLPLLKTGNHLRLVIVVMLCLALLAGWGLDDLTRRRPPPRARPVALALVALLLVAPVLVLARRGELTPGLLGRALEVAWGFATLPSPLVDPGTPAVVHLSALLVWLPFIAGAGLLLAARLTGRLSPPAFVALAVVLVAADLFRAGMGQTPAIETSRAQPPTTPAIAYLQAQRPSRFVGLQRGFGPPPVIPNLAMRYDLRDARSYDVPVEQRYDRLWRRAIQTGGPTDFPTTRAVLSPTARPALSLLSVSHLVQDPGERPLRDPALPLVYDERDARIYRNPSALPRASVVDAQQTVGGDAELEAVLRPGFDPRRTLVSAEPLPGLGPSPGPGPAGSARVVRDEPERVVIEASARRSAALVLSDLWYPGWKATVDGREVDVHRVDWMLRATTLPAGRHTVELRYEPASWRIGWIVSLVALVGLVALLVVGRRGRADGRVAGA